MNPSLVPSALVRRTIPLVALSLAVAWGAACGTSDTGGASDAGATEDAAWPHEDATTGDATPGLDAASDRDARADSSDATTDDGSAADASTSDGSATDGGADATSADASSSDAGDASDAAVTIDDPFDPRSCDGAAMTSAEALVKLGAAARTKLADATLYRRDRTCTGADIATCGPWGAPVPVRSRR